MDGEAEFEAKSGFEAKPNLVAMGAFIFNGKAYFAVTTQLFEEDLMELRDINFKPGDVIVIDLCDDYFVC